MNKQELIRRIADDSEVSRRDAAVMLDSTLEAIMSTVADGDSVQLLGFGTFEARTRKARTARNPQTGEEVQVPETTVPVFRPGVIFKERVDS